MALFHQHPDLMARADAAQNHPAHANQDVLSIIGCFTDRDQLDQHVTRLERKVADYVEPVRVRRRRAA